MDDDKKEHVWQVGDLCTRPETDHAGIVYRVIDIDGRQFFIKPVFSSLRKGRGHRTRTHECREIDCHLLTLLDLGTERTYLDNFITEEAKRRSQ